jgi:hypothetical protein
LHQNCLTEAVLLSDQASFYKLSRQSERHEYGSPSVRTFCLMSQA